MPRRLEARTLVPSRSVSHSFSRWLLKFITDLKNLDVNEKSCMYLTNKAWNLPYSTQAFLGLRVGFKLRFLGRVGLVLSPSPDFSHDHPPVSKILPSRREIIVKYFVCEFSFRIFSGRDSAVDIFCQTFWLPSFVTTSSVKGFTLGLKCVLPHTGLTRLRSSSHHLGTPSFLSIEQHL